MCGFAGGATRKKKVREANSKASVGRRKNGDDRFFLFLFWSKRRQLLVVVFDVFVVISVSIRGHF